MTRYKGGRSVREGKLQFESTRSLGVSRLFGVAVTLLALVFHLRRYHPAIPFASTSLPLSWCHPISFSSPFQILSLPVRDSYQLSSLLILNETVVLTEQKIERGQINGRSDS